MRKKKGIITSAKMTGTVTVTIHSLAFHPKYKKRFRVSKKFLADAGDHKLAEGDLVVIGETRPQSKRKHFSVLEVLKHSANVSDVLEEAAVDEVINREKTTEVKPDKKEEKTEDSTPEIA
ncbi:MAG: uS17 family ribosomal protein [bacterium]|nr:uS17 family ribosomal protein [bacterium]